MQRELSVGDSLREVFAIYRAQAGVLLPVAFWLFLLDAIVNGLVGDNLALFPLLIAVSTIITTLYRGMVVGLVATCMTAARTPRSGTCSAMRPRCCCP